MDIRETLKKMHPNESERQLEIRRLLLKLDSAHYHENQKEIDRLENEIIEKVED